MSEVVEIETAQVGAERRFVLGPAVLSFLVGGLNATLIVAVSVASGVIYHLGVYGTAGPVAGFVSVGCIVALVYMLPQIYRNELRLEVWLGRRRRRLGHVASAWLGAFAILMLIGFLSKTTDVFSRGWAVLFFVNGFILLLVFETQLVPSLRRLQHAGRISPRRLLLIGSAAEIADYYDNDVLIDGFEIAARLTVAPDPKAETCELGQAALRRAIGAAVDKARLLGVDDILVLWDWSKQWVIREILEGFSMMPVSVHIPAKGVLAATGKLQLSRIGGQTTLSLFSQSLTPIQSFIKRLFDIGMASVALVLLSPLFVVVALLIKLDSKGPVLFRQRRRGYNHREFAILKFRTMTTLDDGDVIAQARKDDPRITRVGWFLRKTNIDELPQFWNVLLGHMSVVGPRPHAVAHDRFFETRILAYPRRLNVRPGITGWAQVNGLRGETDTDEKMRQRVEYDLAYIDNWSLGFDLYILFLTIASPRSYRNAR